MRDRCGSCRNKGGSKGCKFSPNPEKPMMPNNDQICVFIRKEGKSRWEPKPNPHGKIISPMEESQPYPEGAGEIRAPAPIHTGELSLVVWESRRFLVDKEGNCFSNCEKRKPLGHISELQEKEPNKEEVKQGIDWLQKRIEEGL